MGDSTVGRINQVSTLKDSVRHSDKNTANARFFSTMRAVIGHNINMFSIVDWLCFLTDRQRIRNQYMIGASYHRRMKQGHPFFLRAYAVSETRNKLKFTLTVNAN